MKLRGGGIVDSEDFSRGWLVNRIIGRKSTAEGEEDEEAAPALSNGNGNAQNKKPENRWGARGISVSADDGVHESAGRRDADQGMTDPDAFEDDLNDEEELNTNETSRLTGETGDVGNGSEWRDDQAK